MTQVKIFAGICGFTTTVQSEDRGGYKAGLKITSQCPNWKKVDEILADDDINVMTELFKNRQTGELNSRLLDVALKTIPHVSCPVISGTFKALEVSVGLALPKDATITFID
ncbi:DUF6951 family protein [Desulforhopalus singaporensis]|uniref:Uncharacterized protein n=1 Tax=Desulforhopalus singaporensis TaxID=91360 RepID=A0A1H0Q8T2_9BACT|nr:hypothetical protein [Desulforhopalus singaporensis]SDP13734.1 hypothetical protein SAMN05660330_01902 [Desulforhopalus singaporensis]